LRGSRRLTVPRTRPIELPVHRLTMLAAAQMAEPLRASHG
jgi:hypothetical protein